MKVGLFLPLACALVLKSSPDTSGSLTVDACKLGFTQNFYTVFIPRKQLQGHTIVKGTALFSGQMKFEACDLNEKIRLESSDPKFSVRPDGSLYAEQDVSNLSQPIQFMVTARGSKGHTQIWKTVVKLVIARHSHATSINQIVHKSKSHHNHYHNLSQPQQGFSTNGLHWKTQDCIIPPISAPENFRRASSLVPARNHRPGSAGSIPLPRLCVISTVPCYVQLIFCFSLNISMGFFVGK